MLSTFTVDHRTLIIDHTNHVTLGDDDDSGPFSRQTAFVIEGGLSNASCILDYVHKHALRLGNNLDMTLLHLPDSYVLVVAGLPLSSDSHGETDHPERDCFSNLDEVETPSLGDAITTCSHGLLHWQPALYRAGREWVVLWRIPFTTPHSIVPYASVRAATLWVNNVLYDNYTTMSPEIVCREWDEQISRDVAVM